MITCTTWYQKAIYDRFPIKENLVHHKVIAEDFKQNFMAKKLFYALGNDDFCNLQPFLILKHYLSVKKWLE